jgi:hypothetical protein
MYLDEFSEVDPAKGCASELAGLVDYTFALKFIASSCRASRMLPVI